MEASVGLRPRGERPTRASRATVCLVYCSTPSSSQSMGFMMNLPALSALGSNVIQQVPFSTGVWGFLFSPRREHCRTHDPMPICGVPCSLSLKDHSLELFGSSRLLAQKPYVLFRACLALNSLYWLVRSIQVFGENYKEVYWLVYLTHWTYALQTLYYFLALGSAAHLLANSGRKRREDNDIEHGGGIKRRTGNRSGRQKAGMGSSSSGVGSIAGASSTPSSLAAWEAAGTDGDTGGGKNVPERLRKLQWGLLFVCADTSLIITWIYWMFLYNGWIDQLNLQIHLFNSAFMMINVFLGASPFYWEHIGITYIYGAIYLAFDVLFYVCGGIFTSDETVIYYFLDWGRAPGQAITVVAFLLLVALPLVHGVNVLIARARERVRRMRPDWGWQGTDEEELERVMEVSGMLDTDVWAPLTSGVGDRDLYDTEEEEMGGASVFYIGVADGPNSSIGKVGFMERMVGSRPPGGGQAVKRASASSGGGLYSAVATDPSGTMVAL